MMVGIERTHTRTAMSKREKMVGIERENAFENCNE